MTQQQVDDLAYYLDADVCEAVHAALAPCSPDDFVRECLRRDRTRTLEAAEHIHADARRALIALDATTEVR